jgi:hypothetical protein
VLAGAVGGLDGVAVVAAAVVGGAGGAMAFVPAVTVGFCGAVVDVDVGVVDRADVEMLVSPVVGGAGVVAESTLPTDAATVTPMATVHRTAVEIPTAS